MPLENLAKTAATDRRAGRLAAREVLRDLSDLPRLRSCGHALGQEVRGRLTGETAAGVAGLETCGSVWACPVCSAKIARHRTDEVEAAIRAHSTAGGSFALLTLTIRHHQGDRLRTLWDGLLSAWRMLGKDRTASAARKGLGEVGSIRTTEVTVGANGWHVHLHVLVFLAGSEPDLMSRYFSESLVGRWRHCVAAQGFDALAEAQDWRLLRGTGDALTAVAGYLNKGEYREVSLSQARSGRAVAMEVTRGDLKDARFRGSRTPFGVLADLTAEVVGSGWVPDDDARLWREWETVSKGRRQQVWSRGLRDRLGLGPDLTDEQVAAVEVEGVDVWAMDADEWARLAASPGEVAALLDVMESAGSLATCRIACAEWLTLRGYRHRIVWPMESVT